MDFEELERIGAAPTVEGELRSVAPWAWLLAIGGVLSGGILLAVFGLAATGEMSLGKIGALSRNLLLVLGLSAWLGSYLLFRLARASARLGRDPNAISLQQNMAIASWMWRGTMVVALAAGSLAVSIANDLFRA